VRADPARRGSARPGAYRLALLIAAAAGALPAPGCGGRRTDPAGPRAVEVVEQASGTTALLQAVSPVNDTVVWVSGHRGTWARTTDGGATWRAAQVPAAESLQFRDVHAVDARTAYLLAAGPGDRSRIYRTTDGGATWREQFRNTEPEAFYDCFAFWSPQRGLAVSDAVRGRLIILVTADGERWTPVPADGIPEALPGEAAFAASGTCVVARGDVDAWIGTGAPGGARVYRTGDGGRTWSVAPTPVVAGEASGIAALAFRDRRTGIALGGRIGAPADTSNHAAVTRDGGRTWTRAGRPPFAGAVYGAAWVPGTRRTVAAAGPGGLALSRDAGATWRPVDERAFWAVAFASPSAGWAVGPGGRVVRLRLRPR
jgi:photosystem II stability/assembly factor-like uncharacterized protein